MDHPRRDDVFERELRQALAAEGRAAAGPHLDAELAAAWMDRHLDAGTARSVEAHLAGCHDCQILIATVARTALEAEVPERVSWWRRLRAGWVVPATAAAAVALIVWIAVPRQRAAPTALETAAPAVAPSTERDAAARLGEPTNTAEPQRQALNPEKLAPRAPVPAPSPAPMSPSPPSDSLEKREQFADAAPPAASKETVEAQQPLVDGQRANAAPGAGRTASLQGALLRESARRDAGPDALAIAAPDGARWRRTGGVIEFAPRADAAFGEVTLPADAATVTAGASPGGTVCWLVGRGGLILVTVDGVRFERVAPASADDLVAVIPTDARLAIVTAANGRRFRTTDRGASWAPLP